MTHWVIGAGLLALWVGASLAGLALARRASSMDALREHHDIAGFIYAIIGVVYGVMLGFVTLVVWEHHEAVESHAAREAAALADLYRFTAAMPAPLDATARERLRAYTVAVIDDEWAALEAGHASAAAREAFDALWRAYLAEQPDSPEAQLWLAESLDALGEVGEYRRLRLVGARFGVPGPLWAVLLVGGAITISFGYMFGAPNPRMHGLMIASLSTVIGLVLLVILSLEHPFSGAVRVEPTAFQEALEAFRVE